MTFLRVCVLVLFFSAKIFSLDTATFPSQKNQMKGFHLNFQGGREPKTQTCIQKLFGVSSPLGAVSRKTRQLIGPEKQFVKLWSTRYEKLLFYYVSNTRKGKITAKFKSLKRVLIEDTKGFMSPEKFRNLRETCPWHEFLNNHLVGLLPFDSSISFGPESFNYFHFLIDQGIWDLFTSLHIDRLWKSVKLVCSIRASQCWRPC